MLNDINHVNTAISKRLRIIESQTRIIKEAERVIEKAFTEMENFNKLKIDIEIRLKNKKNLENKKL